MVRAAIETGQVFDIEVDDLSFQFGNCTSPSFLARADFMEMRTEPEN